MARFLQPIIPCFPRSVSEAAEVGWEMRSSFKQSVAVAAILGLILAGSLTAAGCCGEECERTSERICNFYDSCGWNDDGFDACLGEHNAWWEQSADCRDALKAHADCVETISCGDFAADYCSGTIPQLSEGCD